MTRHRRFAAALCGLSAGVATGAFAAPPPTPAAVGRALFMQKNCYFCHGVMGQGALPTGSTLAPKPLPAAAIRAYVRNPRGVMPAYSPEILTDGEIDSIHAYLDSIPAGRPASEIPLLGGSAPAKTTGR
ncbi:MAG TPA: cytochrome c [Caulobacteraceae bacterium]|nr:cytochrome c [Caulobacteraceae bacterium]